MLRSINLLRCRTACVNLKQIITYRNFTNTVCKESFQTRALKYFMSAAKLQKSQPRKLQVSQEYYEDLLPRAQKLLESVYNDLRKVQSSDDLTIRQTILSDIDTKCFSIVHTLKPHFIFDLLNHFFHAYPRHIQTTYFYEKAISYLVTAAGHYLLTDQEIVKLLFYLSVNKGTAQCYIHDIRPLIPDITTLSLLEKCVVADCFVKSQIEFTTSESEEFERIIEDQFDLIKKDLNLLIILCRALSSISTRKVLTLKKLTNTIISKNEPWDFSILVNLLNLYSKALLFEPKVVDCLVKDGIDAMKKDLECDIQCLQLQDIGKFVKSLCNLGLTMTTGEKRVLKNTVEKRFHEYKQVKYLSYFVNTLLCLHILQCWSIKILNTCFKSRIFDPVYHNTYLWRVQPKLKLLLTQVELEMKIDTPTSLDTQLTFKFNIPENVIKLESICFNLIDEKVVHKVYIDCPIDALSMPGVTLKTKNRTYHVDVLDNTTCLKNTNIPHGYTNLKIRLLSRLYIRHILVQKNLLEKPEEVVKYIRDKINYGQASTFHSKW